MLNLKDRKWREFKIGDIFDIYTGGLIARNLLRYGQVPRISAKEQDNGIVGYYQPIKINNYRELKNFISISFLGGVFYHPYTASLDMKIHAITIKGYEFNPALGIFLVRTIRNEVSKFSYGDQLSSSDLPKQIILLPISKKGIPDWKFMESYIREREKLLIEQYCTLAKTSKHNHFNINEISVLPLNKKEWKEFPIDDIFDIISGKDIVPLIDNGNTPYINSSGINNGVTNYVKNGIVAVKDVITIARTGTVGATFYQSYLSYISGNIRAIKLKNGELNKYTAHFIITMFLKSIQNKFNYGKILGSERIKQQTIMLPVNSFSLPDWTYMEQYAKVIMIKQVNTYLKYLKRSK